MTRLALLLACALALAAPARADEWRHQVRADLGIASAVGWGGLTYTYAALPGVWLEGGVGKGITGYQFSFMPKLAFPAGPGWFVVGAGPALSLKPLDTGDVGGAFHTVGTGAWLNADVGYQYRARSGFSWYVAAGPAVGLGSNYMVSVFGYPHSWERTLRGMVAPQARVGIGYSF